LHGAPPYWFELTVMGVQFIGRYDGLAPILLADCASCEVSKRL
jgi:hypothetical protein